MREPRGVPERLRAVAGESVYGDSDVEGAVNAILEHMIERLATGGRIENRGFGAFSLRHRKEGGGRNPNTGAPVSLLAGHALDFKPGQRLRERVDTAASSV